MKGKQLLIGAMVLLTSLSSVAQEKNEFEPSGKANGKIFWNYHYDMTTGEKQESSFEIQRAYFGYDYQISKEFSASITFDVGKDDGSDYTAYLKKAQLDWKMSPVVKVSLGMIGLEQFSEQENFWGYRYIMKAFADQYGFGTSADLGVKAKFQINDILYANAFVINGEGYKKVQDEDGKQKVGADLVLKTKKGLIAKVYFDTNTTTVVEEGGTENDVTVSALAGFIGYEFSDKFRLGAEFNQLFNGKKYSTAADGYDLNGWSFYSTYAFNKKVEVFGRYDNLTSNTLNGETEKWNLSKNGSAITTGIQYAPVKGVKMALNYQGFMHKDSSKEDNSLLFVNFEFKF